MAHAQQDEEKTPLGKKMGAMNAAFKAVGLQIDDAALALEPEKQSKVPAAEQAKFNAGYYQKGMKDFIATVQKLQVAIKAGKNTDAVAVYDEMKGMQREGHKEYRIKKAGAPPGRELSTEARPHRRELRSGPMDAGNVTLQERTGLAASPLSGRGDSVADQRWRACR